MLTLWTCQLASTFTKGGALQGREDSNPRRAVLEAAVLAAELRPYVLLLPTKNRPGDVPSRGSS